MRRPPGGFEPRSSRLSARRARLFAGCALLILTFVLLALLGALIRDDLLLACVHCLFQGWAVA